MDARDSSSKAEGGSKAAAAAAAEAVLATSAESPAPAPRRLHAARRSVQLIDADPPPPAFTAVQMIPEPAASDPRSSVDSDAKQAGTLASAGAGFWARGRVVPIAGDAPPMALLDDDIEAPAAAAARPRTGSVGPPDDYDAGIDGEDEEDSREEEDRPRKAGAAPAAGLGLARNASEAQKKQKKRRNRPKWREQMKSISVRWRDASIRKKLMVMVVAAQLLSLLFMVGVVVLVLYLSSASQLAQQSQSELLTNQIVYDIKNNQMNFGFAGQAENPAIVEAAKLGLATAQDAILARATDILLNEIIRRDIEYSTLLTADDDPVVIVSCNRNRRGETMPELRSFVRAVIKGNKPMRSSLLVSRKELVEGEGAVPRDPDAAYFLVRFIGRPVYTTSDQSGGPQAVLLAGDVVNGKNYTVEPAKSAFKSGQVAVYQRSRPDCASSDPGCFRVAASMSPSDAEPRLTSPFGSAVDGVLGAASDANGGIVTSVVTIGGGGRLTVSAKALQDPEGRSVGFLVRGTAHSLSDELLRTGVASCVAAGVVSCVAACLLAGLLEAQIMRSLRRLKEAVEEFFGEDSSCSFSKHSFVLSRAFELHTSARDEIGRLTGAFSKMSRRVVESYGRLEEAKERAMHEEMRQKLIFDTSNDAVFVADRFGIVMSMNPSAIAMFGYQAVEVIGKNIKMLMPPDQAKNHDAHIQRHLASGAKFKNHFRDVYGLRKNGAIFPVQISLSELTLGEETLFVSMARDITERKEMELAIMNERNRTERLLKNLLPPTIADRLKDMQEREGRTAVKKKLISRVRNRASLKMAAGAQALFGGRASPELEGAESDLVKGALADRVDDVPVLFADIVNFTPLAAAMDPVRLVRFLNDVFSDFDALAERYNLEKIKTIGDAFMCAGGVPPDTAPDSQSVPKEMELPLDVALARRRKSSTLRLVSAAASESGESRRASVASGLMRAEPPVVRMAHLALAMHEVIARHKTFDGKTLRIRIGIHIGTVIAGVIGKKKVFYDLWGDAVNTASRLESTGTPGRTQVSEEVHDLIRDRFVLEERGTIEVKGKGAMRTFFLVASKPEADLPDEPYPPEALEQEEELRLRLEGLQEARDTPDRDPAISIAPEREAPHGRGPSRRASNAPGLRGASFRHGASFRRARAASVVAGDPRLDEVAFAAWGWPQSSLADLAVAMLRSLGVAEACRADDHTLHAFVEAAIALYQEKNAFHNSVHALDVMQCMYLFLLEIRRPVPQNAPAALPAADSCGEHGTATAAAVVHSDPFALHEIKFDDVETMALMIAALCHDLDHPGVTNGFLLKSKAPMALLYSNSSPLERHHVSTFLALLQRGDLEMMDGLSPPDRERFTQLAVDAILATDMMGHNDFLLTLARRRKPEAAPALPGGRTGTQFDQYDNKALFAGLLLKCADLVNGARTFENSQHWAVLIQQEFFEQAALEAELGLEVTPGFAPTDEIDLGSASRQIGFLGAIVRPLYKTLHETASWSGVAAAMAANVGANLQQWRAVKAAQAQGAPSEAEGA